MLGFAGWLRLFFLFLGVFFVSVCVCVCVHAVFCLFLGFVWFFLAKARYSD